MAKTQSKLQKNLRHFFRVFFSRGWVTKLCFVLIILFVFCALFAPVLTPFTPYEQDLLSMLQGPSSKHLLGTDMLGRDTLTRLLYGARVSLITGLLSSIWAALVGTTLGLVSGYFGGWINTVVCGQFFAEPCQQLFYPCAALSHRSPLFCCTGRVCHQSVQCGAGGVQASAGNVLRTLRLVPGHCTS